MDKEEDNSYHKINLNWYPGHMAKTKRQIIEDLKLIDIVVEIVDARLPNASRNPDILEITKGKERIVVLNKADLADDKSVKDWVKYFNKQGIEAVITDSNTGKGINESIRKIEEVYERLKNKSNKSCIKVRTGKAIRIMVLGIPNVGKSSYINRMAKRVSAKVGNKPGVTKQKQWVKVANNIELLDTPGVLWPKLSDEEGAKKLAYVGTIKDDILDKQEIAYQLVKYLLENGYKKNLKERYKLSEEEIDKYLNMDIEENEKIVLLMEEIGRKRGAIVSGGRVDFEKISRNNIR